jgi:uncharacterized membrane protein HdeD (DUF308 family)
MRTKVFLFFTFFYSSFLSAAAQSTLGDLANNLTKQSPPWEMLITASAYLIGLSFIISGTIKLKHHREMPQQVPLLAPIVLISVGGFLVYFPSTITVLAKTFFGNSQISTGVFFYNSAILIDGTTLQNISTTS